MLTHSFKEVFLLNYHDLRIHESRIEEYEVCNPTLQWIGRKNLKEHRLGPFSVPSILNLLHVFNPVGLLHVPISQGWWRMLTNLSSRLDIVLMICLISNCMCSLNYFSFNDSMYIIQTNGKRTPMAIFNISSDWSFYQ